MVLAGREGHKEGGPGVSRVRGSPERKPPGRGSGANPKARKNQEGEESTVVRSPEDRTRQEPRTLTVPTRDKDRRPREAYA
ncbi:hypothetical protein NDU88_003926 [Pleurodeles waltl]|uniref:Uncharacterized protein n=1 Tax=Pleurodeles waltl TaxID=8319 RepID=A0AAV7WV07_PLEWA|nr:hypothetical protein NDU88_003926 [Pleurodeles waltl]